MAGATVLTRRGLLVRSAGIVLLICLLAHRNRTGLKASTARREIPGSIRIVRAAAHTAPTSLVSFAPTHDGDNQPPTRAQKVDGLKCAICGVSSAAATGNSGPDFNCCYHGGSWAGQCGRANSSKAFSWQDGFRICNNMTMEPEPPRIFDGPFLPLQLADAYADSYAARMLEPSDASAAAAAAAAAAATGTASRATDTTISGQAFERGTASELQVYLLTLRALLPAQRRMHRLLSSRGRAQDNHGNHFHVTALAAVPAHDALRVAGVPPESARDVFGPQSGQREFESALGCALSHLRAARRALLDGASSALVLEEDATPTLLQPLWLAPLHALTRAMPARWEVLQLAMLATRDEWSELRGSWRSASRSLGAASLVRTNHYWSTAAYLLHARGARRLVDVYRRSARQRTGANSSSSSRGGGSRGGGSRGGGSRGGGSSSSELMKIYYGDGGGGGGGDGGGDSDGSSDGGADAAVQPLWQLGTANVRCVQADSCVIFPTLPAESVFVAAPPFFTCAEGERSSIRGHDEGEQREIHSLSRREALAFAEEARREQESLSEEAADEAAEDAAAAAEEEEEVTAEEQETADAETAEAGVRHEPQLPSAAHSVAAAASSVDPLESISSACPWSGGVRPSAFLGKLSKRGGTAGGRVEKLGAGGSELTVGLDSVYVHRRAARPTDVLRFRRSGAAGAGYDDAHNGTHGQVLRFSSGAASYSRAGTWRSVGQGLVVEWSLPSEPAPSGPAPLQLLCRVDGVDGSHSYAAAATPSPAHTAGEELLAPLLPPAARMASGRLGGSAALRLPFRFWIHESAALWWQPLLQCTPDWDVGLDAQSAAEVWLLAQLSVHPNRSETWEDSSVVVLPLLPKTSLQAGSCLGSTHSERLTLALAAMLAHPVYARRHGHDHLLLSNYWDAWGALGARGSASHTALSNVTVGWHETQRAAWGMANHRYVGKCQVALPYVETARCAARSESALLSADRPAPLFFSGSVSDFDTTPGEAACPNVARHATAVRRAFVTLGEAINGSDIRSLPHNLRSCNGSASCEGALKSASASAAASARLCPVAAGDTPSTGRLYDAIACLCVPLIVTDDLQLPFPHDEGLRADTLGVRLRESVLLADPAPTVRRLLAASAEEWSEQRSRLLLARRRLAYRTPGSLVATLALKEAWMSCLREETLPSRDMHYEGVAKC